MLVNLFAIRLLSHAAGTLLCVVLLVILLRKRHRTGEDWLLTALVAAAGAWQVTGALLHYLVPAGAESAQLSAALEAVRTGAACLAPALVLHLSLLWARLARWSWFLLYPVALVVWWRLSTGRLEWAPLLFVLAVVAAAGALIYARRKSTLPYDRLYLCLALCMLLLAAVAWRGADSTLLAVASLAAPVCLVRFIYRFHVFDLLISRRVLFVFTLAGATALYLVVVRALAGWAEAQLDAFGPLLELTLILGAAVTWLPMYEVITRFFSRPGMIHAEFSRRVIEEAARILDVQGRAQYLVEQVGRTFQLRRAALVFSLDPPRAAHCGPQEAPLTAESVKKLAGLLEARGHGLVHVHRLRPHQEARQVLRAVGFNYLFPLRYEDGLTGMLLLDTSPRVFLDENETVLLGLSRQMSLSIESCRLAESKLGLERELLHQEHLATLGKAATTIAHEVKNPLSSIKTLAQLLREDPEVLERYGRDLTYMIAETDRLNSSVQQLLTFARPLPGPGGEVDLSELLGGAADFLARESAGQGVRIERRIAPDLRLACADRVALHQVVVNLLLNAVQASPSGGRVALEAGREDGGRIRLRIADEGPGIPEELREKVFEPFFTTRQQGTGLGLAIVMKNVRQLRGEIEVQTPVAEGRGTSVSVLLPEA